MNSQYEWDGFSHRALYDQIHGRAWFGEDGAGTSGAAGAQAGWADLATLMASARERTEAALVKAGAVWEGEAAYAMRSGVTPLAQWADDAHTASTASQSSTDAHVEEYSTAKNRMPEPVPVTSTANSDGLGIPAMYTRLLGGQTDQDKQEAAAQEAKAEAVRTMRHYDNQSAFSRLTVGRFTPPPSVTVDVSPMSQPGGGDGIPVGVSEWSGRPGNDGPGPGGDTAGDTPGPGATPPPGGSPTPPSGTSPSANSPTPLPVAPPSHGPVTGPVPDQRPALWSVPPGTGRAPIERGPGGAGRGFGAERGPGAGRGAGPGAGGVRGGVPGVGGVVSESVAGRSGAGGARGSNGIGMGPAGARGQGDEDKEHQTAEYLRGSHDDFWDDTPPVAPAVIGEDED